MWFSWGSSRGRRDQVPGLLSSGERAVAPPDSEGTFGGVCRREGDEEGGHHYHHLKVQISHVIPLGQEAGRLHG